MSTLNKILGRADANKDVGVGSAVNSGATATEGSGVQGVQSGSRPATDESLVRTHERTSLQVE